MGNVQKLQSKPTVRLVTAAGTPLHISNYVQAPVQIGGTKVIQQFLVVESLIAPIILGLDFMRKHKVTLDFSTIPVGVRFDGVELEQQQLPQEVKDIWRLGCTQKTKLCAASVLDEDRSDLVDECSIPNFGAEVTYDFPKCQNQSLSSLIREYKDLFRAKPGLTEEAQHFIHTTGSPVRVPPRRIPVHYREEVECQIQEMLRQGIIKESSS